VELGKPVENKMESVKPVGPKQQTYKPAPPTMHYVVPEEHRIPVRYKVKPHNEPSKTVSEKEPRFIDQMVGLKVRPASKAVHDAAVGTPHHHPIKVRSSKKVNGDSALGIAAIQDSKVKVGKVSASIH
jgi:phosphotransferase system HPr-like phosphotransfer protein